MDTSTLIRTPVRITATSKPRLYEHLIGHEGTVYSGDTTRAAVRLLSPLVRLSEEAAAHPWSCSGYVSRDDVTVEEIAAPSEKVLL